MGNTGSTTQAAKDQEEHVKSKVKFKQDFCLFLSAKLTRDATSRHVLTVREVIRQFLQEYPEYQSFHCDGWQQGYQTNHIVDLIHKELGCCVMVHAIKSHPPDLLQLERYCNNYSKCFETYYEGAIILGYLWKSQGASLIDL